MKRERIKNTILIALVISSLILTGKIWFNEKLWPEGYNFFVDIKASTMMKVSKIFGLKIKSDTSERTSIVLPTYLAAYMVKDFDHAITVLNKQSKDYVTINDYTSRVIKDAMSGKDKNVIKVSEEDWRKALFTRGFYVDYGISYKAATFAQLFGVYESSILESVESVKSFIITAEDSVISNVSVYALDEEKDEFYKISTGLDRVEFNEKLSKLTDDATPKKRFSFFINADVPTGIAGETIFAPYLILDEESSEYEVIDASNPVASGGSVDISMYTTERLLKAFSINPNTAIKYADAKGSIMFVQSKNTLELSPDGVLSYTTVEGGKGLKLVDNVTTQQTAQTLSKVVELVEKICSTLINDDGTELYLSNLEENQNFVRAYFNYIYDGVPIILDDEHNGEAAVVLELENGHLKSYRQILRQYAGTTQMSSTESIYDAKVFNLLSDEEKISGIERLYRAYSDDGSDGDKKATWFVKINGVDGYKR